MHLHKVEWKNDSHYNRNELIIMIYSANSNPFFFTPKETPWHRKESLQIAHLHTKKRTAIETTSSAFISSNTVSFMYHFLHCSHLSHSLPLISALEIHLNLMVELFVMIDFEFEYIELMLGFLICCFRVLFLFMIF